MKLLVVVVLLFSSIFMIAAQQETGGGACAACTIGMKVLQDYAKKEGNIRRAVENICGFFPDQFKAACKVFMVAFSSVIIREFERGATPDK
jgi:hypothetical protein